MVIDGVTVLHSWRSKRMAKTIDGKRRATLKRRGICAIMNARTVIDARIATTRLRARK